MLAGELLDLCRTFCQKVRKFNRGYGLYGPQHCADRGRRGEPARGTGLHGGGVGLCDRDRRGRAGGARKAGRLPAQVVITDLNMPRLDGFGLLRRLAEQGSAVPTIVLGFGSIENAVATVHDLGGVLVPGEAHPSP